MPTSVLLAVLAAAGLLALAPALVRRYDATERLVAERALSTARVLTRADRQWRRRTVPGRRPVNPPRVLARQVAGAAAFAAGAAVFAASSALTTDRPGAHETDQRPDQGPSEPRSGRAAARRSDRAAGGGSGGAPRGQADRAAVRSHTIYRRRRALVLLALLTVAEAVTAALAVRTLWIAVSFTGFMLVAFVVHLRNRALTDQRRRRAEARYARWVAAHQAAVRREQARRAAARRELLDRQLAARELARRAELRGRPYDSRAAGQ